MKRDDVKVIKNLNQEDGYPSFYVVLAKEIENYAADGTSNDYSLENEESTCWSDLQSELESKYPGTSYELGDNNEINIDESYTDIEVSKEKLAEIRKFAADWLKEHEWHDDATWWNYFDGSNWKSELLHSGDQAVDDNKSMELLSDDDEDAINVLAAYDRAEDAHPEFEQGYATYHDEETGYDVRFSQWSGHASMADIF